MTWAHHFQNDVTGDFEESVGNEEQGNSSVVLHAAHLQLIRHTSDFRIADYSIVSTTRAVDFWSRLVGIHTVAAIDERDEIEQRK